jgi:hypothetical protein
LTKYGLRRCRKDFSTQVDRCSVPRWMTVLSLYFQLMGGHLEARPGICRKERAAFPNSDESTF